MGRNILIIVDMQNDFITGALGTPEAQAIVPYVKNQLKFAREQGYEIYFTFDTHNENYFDTLEGKVLPVSHCQFGTKGWDICENLNDTWSHNVLKSTFGYPNWNHILGSDVNIDHIVLMGVCTDICVISNALILRAWYPNTPIYVDQSGCAGTTPENHQAALRVMESCQIRLIGE